LQRDHFRKCRSHWGSSQSNKCQSHCGNNHTPYYVTLLTTSNTAPTNTTAAADEVDYVVRIRKKLSGFDFQKERNTRFSFLHSGYQATV